MHNPNTPLYKRLHGAINNLPVIDCHEHMAGPQVRPPLQEPIAALVEGYTHSDLISAAHGLGISNQQVMGLVDAQIPTDEKWPVFERLWRACEHTAYLRVSRLVLQNVYGEGKLSRQALEHVAEQLPGRDEAAYMGAIEAAGIRTILSDNLGRWASPTRFADFLTGAYRPPAPILPLIPLPDLHPTATGDLLPWVEALSGRTTTSLDEFLEAVFEVFQTAIQRGAIGLKDQSAYQRSLSYDLPPKAEAEKQFNQLLIDPRQSLGWPEGKPLNDYLFHQYMRFAAELDLPVQVHTGHMAGIYNRVEKANAAHLASVLELHRQVRFDLFHGNWPYLDDLLFLGKNYPNAALDLCWLYIIDPPYACELLERSVYTLPHTKLHGFGGDYLDNPEFTVGHLQIAREVMAGALANLVESGWLSEEAALQVAADWLFNNPNRFFRLGYEEVQC